MKKINRTKKIAALSLSLIMTAGMLSSCGSGGKSDIYNGGEYQQKSADTNAPEEQADYEYSYEDNDHTLNTNDAVAEDFYNTEEYAKYAENGFKLVSDNPLSTFSIDVDTASYTNVRRMINNGQAVEPDAVRIEEFINYFKYDYPAPQGDDPVSITTELSDCPWNADSKLMLVGMKAEDIEVEERAPMNLVFLIDVSGSMMDENKLPLVQEAFAMLAENLNGSDRISIVTYAGEDRVVLEGADGNDYEAISDALYNLEAGGSTAGEMGINRAYALAEANFIEGGNNRIILATDGDLNVGLSSADELTTLVEQKRESGVFLSVLGFGMGNYKDTNLEAIADNGNGNYSYIDNIDEARRVLVSEMNGTLFTIAKDVKLQLEFNPANVAAYRLVGYENRLLNDEDFVDDTKDAGDMGAGHTVTAMYEIIPAKGVLGSTGEVDIDLKYQTNDDDVAEENATADDIAPPEGSEQSQELKQEMLTIKLRYKRPDSDTSQEMQKAVFVNDYTEDAGNNLRFASCVAEFAMWLKQSEYSTIQPDQIVTVMNDYNLATDEYRQEFVELVSHYLQDLAD